MPSPPQPTTESRKDDHIRINLEEDVQFPNLTTGLEHYRFMHKALPEIDLGDIDTSVELFGKHLNTPILISSMTGGAERAQQINDNLAVAAQHYGIAMGLGSQRAALEDEALARTYQIRKHAPDIVLLANIGAVQLNYGYSVEDCQRAVDMVEADALILHLNVLQEVVQPEGDVNWAGVLSKIEQVVRGVDVPVIAKEVGWGFDPQTIKQLVDVGVAAIDVAGAGGTSWSEVEYHRAPTAFHAKVAAAFADWGIPTADALRYANQNASGRVIIASGGLRDGVDIAKTIALGAHIGGMAGPFLRAAVQSADAVGEFIEQVQAQLKIAMLCSGAKDIVTLRQTPIYHKNEHP